MTAPLIEPSYGGQTATPGTTTGGRANAPVLNSLTNATTGTGGVLDLGAIYSNPVMALSAPATPGAGAVTFEGSLDSNNWYPIASATTVPDTSCVIVTATKPSRYLRARVTTTVTTTTATAVITAAP